MSATARAMLGSIRIADNAVSASFEGVLDADREKRIAGQAVAQVIEMPRQARISPITLVSRTGSATPPEGRYISLDLEDFQ
jgi:hypothetical protein